MLLLQRKTCLCGMIYQLQFHSFSNRELSIFSLLGSINERDNSSLGSINRRNTSAHLSLNVWNHTFIEVCGETLVEENTCDSKAFLVQIFIHCFCHAAYTNYK